jgi:hypothetical protein
MNRPALPFEVLKLEPVGSRVTVRPAPTDTDEDWLALVSPGEDRLLELARVMRSDGWEYGGSLADGDHDRQAFSTWRQGEVNVILTTSPEFFRRFIVGRDICKRLNLKLKADRVYVHRRVRDDLDDRGPVQNDPTDDFALEELC